MTLKIPMPRFRLVTLLSLVALIALGLGGWREYWSPKWVWRRAIHKSDYSRGLTWLWLQLNPRIDGLDREETLAEVDRAASDWHPSIRVAAIEAYPFLELDRSQAIARIIAHLDDSDTEVRCAIARALVEASKIPRPSPIPVIPTLITLIHDREPSVRNAALHALLESGAVYPEVFPTVQASLNDTDADIRRTAAAALNLLELEEDQ